MDFKTLVITELEYITPFWWNMMIYVAIIAFLIQILRRKSFGKMIAGAGFTASVLFILVITCLGRNVSEETYNLKPFWSYVEAYNGNQILRDLIILNYLLFIPTGFFLNVQIDKLWKTLLFGLCLSTMIELVQLRYSLGLFEFDDIIGNTLGCLLGAVVGTIWCFICKLFTHKQDNN